MPDERNEKAIFAQDVRAPLRLSRLVVGSLTTCALVAGAFVGGAFAGIEGGADEVESVAANPISQNALDSEVLDRLDAGLERLLDSQSVSAGEIQVAAFDAAGDALDPGSGTTIHSAYAMATSDSGREYRIYIADDTGDTAPQDCETLSRMGAESCHSRVVGGDVVLEMVYVHVALPELGSGKYTVVDRPLENAKLSALRVQRVVEVHPAAGGKLAVVETYFGPSSRDVRSELSLSAESMLNVLHAEFGVG